MLLGGRDRARDVGHGEHAARVGQVALGAAQRPRRGVADDGHDVAPRRVPARERLEHRGVRVVGHAHEHGRVRGVGQPRLPLGVGGVHQRAARRSHAGQLQNLVAERVEHADVRDPVEIRAFQALDFVVRGLGNFRVLLGVHEAERPPLEIAVARARVEHGVVEEPADRVRQGRGPDFLVQRGLVQRELEHGRAVLDGETGKHQPLEIAQGVLPRKIFRLPGYKTQRPGRGGIIHRASIPKVEKVEAVAPVNRGCEMVGHIQSDQGRVVPKRPADREPSIF